MVANEGASLLKHLTCQLKGDFELNLLNILYIFNYGALLFFFVHVYVDI